MFLHRHAYSAFTIECKRKILVLSCCFKTGRPHNHTTKGEILRIARARSDTCTCQDTLLHSLDELTWRFHIFTVLLGLFLGCYKGFSLRWKNFARKVIRLPDHVRKILKSGFQIFYIWKLILHFDCESIFCQISFNIYQRSIYVVCPISLSIAWTIDRSNSIFY